MRKLIIGFSFLVLISQLSAQPRVPSTFTYCEIEVTLTRGARERIQSHVNKIYENPTYLRKMVVKAKMYFPYIEEAFRDERVPSDLKYLSIQESALKPSAVSISNAVGFWQFKLGSAKETGLLIDKYVDERKHIYKASIGSARYFAKANQDFNNWIYSIVSYYEGPTGAIPFTDPTYYGRKKITIGDDFHWYALKAIAHKIAYQPALEEDIPVTNYLMPLATNGHRTWEEVIDGHNVPEEVFFEYNQWITDKKRIPAGQDFTYYLPVAAAHYQGHHDDPNKQIQIALSSPDAQLQPSNDINILSQPISPAINTQPNPISEEPVVTQTSFTSDNYPGSPHVAQPVSTLSRNNYAIFDIEDDLHYKRVYTLYDGKQSFDRFSIQHLLYAERLLGWNRLKHPDQLNPPHILYLGPLDEVPFHIVEQGETLPEITRKHDISLGKLLRKNRMSKSDMTIYVGQKLYLKNKKPKEEKMIVLRVIPEPIPNQVQEEISSPTTASVDTDSDSAFTAPFDNFNTSNNDIGQETEVIDDTPKPTRPPIQQLTSRWIEHTVAQGETLWSISKRYSTKVDIIKRINQIDTTDLYIGQVLKIMANEELGRGVKR